MPFVDINDEIEKREQEKFQSLSTDVQVQIESLNRIEKKEFDKLWSFYTRNLEEIEVKRNLIIKTRKEAYDFSKTTSKQIKILWIFFVGMYIVEFFLLEENRFLYYLTSVLIFGMCLLFAKLRFEIQLAQLIGVEKLYENSERELRHNMHLKGIFNIKYEKEYLDASGKLYGGAVEADKENFSKYSELHFTYVSKELLDLVRKNLG